MTLSTNTPITDNAGELEAGPYTCCQCTAATWNDDDWCDDCRRPAPSVGATGGEGERDEAFCEAYYEAHLTHAWAALRDRVPYQVNADGAIALIQQAKADRAALKNLQPSSAADAKGVAWRWRFDGDGAWSYGSEPPVDKHPHRSIMKPEEVQPLYALTSQQAGTERSGVYVASRASIPERGQMWRDLRASGVNVTSSWIDEDGPGETADFADLWPRIEREVTSSERLICYLEPDDFPIKGVLIEIGMALAAKVPVVIVAPDIELEGRTFRPLGSWIRHPLVTFAPTILAALQQGEAG